MKVYVLTQDEYHDGIFFSTVNSVYLKRIEAIRTGVKLEKESKHVIRHQITEEEVQE